MVELVTLVHRWYMSKCNPIIGSTTDNVQYVLPVVFRLGEVSCSVVSSRVYAESSQRETKGRTVTELGSAFTGFVKFSVNRSNKCEHVN